MSKENNNTNDLIHHPNYYQGTYGLEVLDVIKNFTSDLKGEEAVYTGNVLKYMCRWKKKNGLEDLKKAKQYLDWLIELEEDERRRKHSGRYPWGVENTFDNFKGLWDDLSEETKEYAKSIARGENPEPTYPFHPELHCECAREEHFQSLNRDNTECGCDCFVSKLSEEEKEETRKVEKLYDALKEWMPRDDQHFLRCYLIFMIVDYAKNEKENKEDEE